MLVLGLMLVEVFGVDAAVATKPPGQLVSIYFSGVFNRSPWSNKYEPPIEDGAMPSARLRKLEVEANNAFDQYRDL